MVKPIKSKKSRKNINKSLKKGKRLSSKIQKGGVSSGRACVLDYATNGMKNPNALANLHNLNPQASGDLDNKFMLYGGPVPLGQMGGANKCGDDGVGTSNPKSETFKQYLNTIDEQLSFKGGNRNQNDDNDNDNDNDNDSNHNDENNNNKSNINSLKGGDYSVNPEQYIAGKPVIDGYDHENPPALINGKLVMPGAVLSGGDGNRQLCGNGATRGGSKKSKRNSKRNSKKNKRKTRKSKRQNKKKNNSSKMQKGGDFVSIGSKPAVFSEAFNGPDGVFQYPDDMTKRDFAAKQPNYGVNAI